MTGRYNSGPDDWDPYKEPPDLPFAWANWALLAALIAAFVLGVGYLLAM